MMARSCVNSHIKCYEKIQIKSDLYTNVYMDIDTISLMGTRITKNYTFNEIKSVEKHTLRYMSNLIPVKLSLSHTHMSTEQVR